MAGKDNLRVPTSEEARENGRKGGIASAKARREKKLMRETLSTLLTMPVKDGQLADVEEIKSLASLQGRNISVQDAVLLAMIKKATKGDVRAAEWLRDTIGEKPQDNANINMQLPIFFEGENEIKE